MKNYPNLFAKGEKKKSFLFSLRFYQNIDPKSSCFDRAEIWRRGSRYRELQSKLWRLDFELGNSGLYAWTITTGVLIYSTYFVLYVKIFVILMKYALWPLVVTREDFMYIILVDCGGLTGLIPWFLFLVPKKFSM